MNEQKQSLYERSIKIRGQIINDTIVLERTLDAYLSMYFSGVAEKGMQAYQLIFATDRMSFESKKQIFYFILQTYIPDALSRYPNINKDLTFIIEKRNIIAHQLFSLTDEDVLKQDSQVSFIRVKNTEQLHPITNEVLNDILSKIKDYLTIIQQLTSEII